MLSTLRHHHGLQSLLGYAAVWIAAGAAVAALVLAVLPSNHQDLPALVPTTLSAAARAGDCRVLRPSELQPGDPPVSGPALATAARAAVYDRSPSPQALLAAERRGIVVIRYQAPLARNRLDQLRAAQRMDPNGTIVTPMDGPSPYVVTAGAWHRLLVCGAFNDGTLHAIRIFRARNMGRGPDAGT